MNWVLILVMYGLLIFGVFMIESAARHLPLNAELKSQFGSPGVYYAWSQKNWIVVGSVAFFGAALVDYRWIRWLGIPFYGVSLVLMFVGMTQPDAVQPVRLTILGAMGGPRFDHALANAWLLAHPALDGRTVMLLDARTRVRLLSARAAGGTLVSGGAGTPGGATAEGDEQAQGPATAAGPATAILVGALGDLVSLFPFGADAVGVTTVGLAYPLRDEPLRAGPARGLSNVRTGTQARVSLRFGRLLIVETRDTAGATR